MMRYVVFAVVLATLLSDAVSVPAQSYDCDFGPACVSSNTLSMVDGVRFCCRDNNHGISVSQSSVNGQSTTTCRCSPMGGNFFFASGMGGADQQRLADDMKMFGQRMRQFGQNMGTFFRNMFGNW